MYKQNKIDVDSFKEDQKEVIEINKLILKIQPKFRSIMFILKKLIRLL